MRRGAFRLLAAVGWLLSGLAAGSMSIGQCAERSATVPPPDAREAFARRVFAITDVVLEHHIDPPARQQMILAGFKEALAAAKARPAPDLSRRVSDVRTAGELAALFHDVLFRDVWPPVKGAPGTATDSHAKQFEQAFTNGLLKTVPGQPNLVSAKEARAQSQFQTNRYVGLGIAVNERKDGSTEIGQVIPGGPAERAGVMAGDVIKEIDHQPVAPKTSIIEVVERLRGAEGTKVTVRLGRSDSKDERTLTIARLPVVTKSVEEVPVKGDASAVLKITHLRISSITASTAQELLSWESKLEFDGNHAVVLDFRGSGSRGIESDHSAVLLADALLDGGVLGKLRTRERVREFTADRDCLFRDFPMALLVDKRTWGAAEWVVAAVQDADPPQKRSGHRPLIVGEPTRGDNEVTGAIPIPGSGEFLILPTGVWERPRPDRQTADASDRSDRRREATAGTWRVVPDLPVDRIPVETVGVTVIIPELNMSNIVANSIQFVTDPLAAKAPARTARAVTHAVQAKIAENPGPDAFNVAVAELERQWRAAHRTAK